MKNLELLTMTLKQSGMSRDTILGRVLMTAAADPAAKRAPDLEAEETEIVGQLAGAVRTVEDDGRKSFTLPASRRPAVEKAVREAVSGRPGIDAENVTGRVMEILFGTTAATGSKGESTSTTPNTPPNDVQAVVAVLSRGAERRRVERGSAEYQFSRLRNTPIYFSCPGLGPFIPIDD